MDPVAEFRARELDDRWWRERSADFDQIEVPLLSGANRGANALHLRGNVEAYVRSASRQKWLEIHGGNHRETTTTSRRARSYIASSSTIS
jgi:hypothetical protein